MYTMTVDDIKNHFEGTSITLAGLTDDDIKAFFQGTSITLAELSVMTDKTVEQLKTILMGGHTMQALAIFKEKELDPLSYVANIRGRGIKHIQTLAYRFADEYGFNYSHITYHKHCCEYPTITAKLSFPYYKEV